ncbi:hypothetical protein EDB85DRAFT_215426 [Lactarius pseudohatsudake]|nr:hypothetical protein EDB85DRAFT_215426 [Lactarius pseudohatsudake]
MYNPATSMSQARPATSNIQELKGILKGAKAHSSSSVGFEVDREYVGGIVGSQGSGVNKLRESLGVEVDFSDGGDESKNANKRKGTGHVSFKTDEFVKRPIARADSSRNSNPRAPPATLHWMLLPFDPQRSRGEVRFDFAHDVDEILLALAQGKQGGARPLSVQERNKSAAEPGLTEMVIHCAELPDWPVYVGRRSGVRCVDVFEAIRDTYDVVLTMTERTIHQSRIRDIEGHRQLAAKEGVRRRDLLEGKTLFLGLDWDGSDSLFPYGCWFLKVGSPPRGYSNTSTLQEHYGSSSPW